jgi:hypothetical protein
MRLWLSGLVVMLDFDGRISWQGRVANDDYGKLHHCVAFIVPM